MSLNFFFTAMATVTVTGSGFWVHELEVIEESGDTRVCSKKWNFPGDYFSAAGAILPDNTIVVCGGDTFDPDFDPQYRCYKLKGKKWKSIDILQTARANHAASRIEKGKGIYKRLALIPC